jgi:hypothetical protein
VTLERVFANPHDWIDVPVLLRMTYAGRAASPNPYLTQFTARRWRAVGFRPAGAPDTGEEADAPFERLFVPRGGAADRRASRLAAGDEVEVRAVVRDVVRDEPWLEVLEITGRGDPLTGLERSRRELADRFAARDNAGAAERICRALLASRPLPPADRLALLRRIGDACLAQRKWTAADDAFRQALLLDPDDGLLEERRLQARRGLAAASPAKEDPARGKDGEAPPDGRPRAGLRPPAGLDGPSGDDDPPAHEKPDEERPEAEKRKRKPKPDAESEPPAEKPRPELSDPK